MYKLPLKEDRAATYTIVCDNLWIWTVKKMAQNELLLKGCYAININTHSLSLDLLNEKEKKRIIMCCHFITKHFWRDEVSRSFAFKKDQMLRSDFCLKKIKRFFFVKEQTETSNYKTWIADMQGCCYL